MRQDLGSREKKVSVHVRLLLARVEGGEVRRE